jgi:hypothetical protein
LEYATNREQFNAGARNADQRNSNISNGGSNHRSFAGLALRKKVGLVSKWMAEPRPACLYRVVALQIVLNNRCGTWEVDKAVFAFADHA